MHTNEISREKAAPLCFHLSTTNCIHIYTHTSLSGDSSLHHMPPWTLRLLPAETAEYCQFDFFNATCRTSEELSLVSARYGRPRIGRCVPRTLGYLGCVVDALSTLEGLCTDRHNCSVRVSDGRLRDLAPCPADVASHLEVDYRCLKGGRVTI